MGVRDFLKPPKIHRRARSETRSETVSESTEGPSSAAAAVSHLAGSTPDLGIDPSTSPKPSSLTSRGQQSKGLRTFRFPMVHLMAPFSRNADSNIVDRVRSIFNKKQSKRSGPSSHVVDPSETDGNPSSVVPLVASAATLMLRGVKETADAFPPLKAVAGFLCFILDNCEVQHVSRTMLNPILTSVLENDGMSPSGRIIDTTGRGAGKVAGYTSSQG